MLDGTSGFPRIGSPIARIDGANAYTGDLVDIAYFSPGGNVVNTNVDIWHTHIVARPDVSAGAIAVLGTPAPGTAFGPGGPGDSGGGLFRHGVHIGNVKNWVREDCSENGTIIGHSDAYWISYLNP
jgi:hypothetical protein